MMLHRLSTIRSGTRSPGAEKRKRELLYLLPCISTVGLLTIGSMMLGCIGSESVGSMAYAEGDEGTSSEIMPVALGDTVSLALKNDGKGDSITEPATTKEVAYITKGFRVNASGEYNIYVQSTSGTSDLVNGAARIPTVSSNNVDMKSVQDSAWGYTVAETETDPATLTYNQVQTSSTNAIVSGNNTNGDKDFMLAFAAKFGSNASAGHYRSNIVLSVAATPEEVADSWTIHNMQDMNATICMNAKEGTTGQLTDLRDGKTYWVTKLADGNCWMVQNLDYDDPNSARITSTSGTNGGPSEEDWSSNNSVRQYWDPGEKIVGVDDNIGRLVDAPENTDSHYLVGNYYSFASVTDGTGVSLNVDGENATSSICPSGWQLPTGGNSNNGSFENLLAVYSIDATDVSKLYNSPLYFPYNGVAHPGVLNYAGSVGQEWTSTSRNNSRYAYFLRFELGEIVTVNSTGNRYTGKPARCLVQAEDKKSIETSTYMDEVTPLVCKNSELEKQTQLIDRRDGKKYWVAQLKDGACWMTQNLDYDIPESVLPGVKRFDSKTGLGGWPDPSTFDGITRYYDPGDYYYDSTSRLDINCHNVSDGLDNEACRKAGFTKEGNAHFHVGNYYNWYAATKGSGTTSTVGNASDSICPTRWRLPKGSVDESGSFGTANMTKEVSADKASLLGAYKITNDENGMRRLRQAPFYFLPVGYIGQGVVFYAGTNAHYWSATSSTANQILNFAFNVDLVVNPAITSRASYGLTVRCAVR